MDNKMYLNYLYNEKMILLSKIKDAKNETMRKYYFDILENIEKRIKENK